MLIRTYADIEKLAAKEGLSKAERTLLNNCKKGVSTVLGSGTLPKRTSAARRVRADLLRYVILGGCEDCLVHEFGVHLVGGWIDGQLDLSFAEGRGSTQLICCHFAEPFIAHQASIKSLVLNHSSVVGISAQQSVISGNVNLDGIRSIGLIDLGGAELGGQLSIVAGDLDGGRQLALNAQGATIVGGVFLDRLKCAGTASFSGADIGGQLTIEDADLDGCGGYALNAQSSKVKGCVFLDHLKSAGTVSFVAARIGRLFTANDARLDGGERESLDIESATIDGNLSVSRLQSAGSFDLASAKVRGHMMASNAQLDGRKGCSLKAHDLTIGGNVTLERLKSTGTVELLGATIGGQLSLEGAELNGNEGYAFSGQGAKIGEALFWQNVRSVIGRIDLNGMHVGVLADDEGSWKSVSKLNLIGLTYDRLAYPNGLAFRKRWLRKGSFYSGTFYPQPYQQLAKFYRESGHRQEAREILIAKEREQRKAVRASIRRGRSGQESVLEPNFQIFIYKLWDEMMRVVAGYGYKPWLSLWWLGGLVAAMTLWSHFVWQAGDFAPNSAVVLTSADWKVFSDGTPERPPSDEPAIDWSSGPGRDYETFYSFAYAMDVVVPVLELGQMEAWAPSPARGAWGYWLFYGQKIFVVLGWVVTALAAAAVTGMIRRDD